MDQFIGEIRLFAGTFAPEGWFFCNGQLLAISEYTTLFSLIGTTYGGDGQTTFGLPDLRGRVPVGQGIGAGLTNRTLGETGGVETVTLNALQIGVHNHPVIVSTAPGDTSTPAGNVLASSDATKLYSSATPSGALSGSSVAQAGSSQPHPNLQPTLAVNFIIALNGIYPTQG